MSQVSAELNHQVAEKLFGWKWMSWVGIPIRGTPGYPKKCRVREFFSPERREGKDWQQVFAIRDGREATGDEPLSYSYCSSQGGERVPCYVGSEDILVLEHVQATWPRASIEAFIAALANVWGERGKAGGRAWMAWALYQPGDYSRAVLAVLDENEGDRRLSSEEDGA